ncbi:trypsin-like peptidase domain-containing protein [Streptomyces sp. NPDC093544]|uniref:trypsin-like peptidase domain-containing protein n=1 Tax=Streptomyces sp. NPDC093544 TaxID=3155200 RepID=UPI0034412997
MPPAPDGLRVEFAAEVIVELPGGGRRRGSGYLIARQKVLTARHLVADAVAVRVRFNADRPGEMGSTSAVVWAHAGIDIAVLAVPGAPPAVPAEFGRAGERDAVIHGSAVGFPAFKMRTAPDGSRYRDAEHVHATCAVLSNRREGTLDLSVLPPASVTEGSPWSGMSGAAVHSRGRIIGVIAEHHLSDGPGRLAASRVDRWAEQLTDSDLVALEIVLGVGLRPQDLEDVIPPNRHELALTAFTAHLQDLAPDELLDRQPELENLIAFCAGPDPYLWIQGAPWSGKTALASWLSLHPPHGIVPVWFFITNRLAGNAESPAYVESLIQQCAALARRDPIDSTAPAARAGELRLLLAEAVKRVAADGTTLLLIVDGLDEDRSSGPSIASLLPSTPPANMRVLVTSRSHPGLPADVDADHPLQGCPVLRLEPSAAARNTQHEAVREMDEALRGDELTRDLIGLVAAARGSLTVRDLQELTGRRPFELEQRLGGPLGRILRSSGSAAEALAALPQDSPPATRRERGYLFAHDTLLAAAGKALGYGIDDYQARIKTWAADYAEAGWPPGTPDYLLSSYAQQITSLGDPEGAVQLATDARRIERIAESIGIAPVLAENISVEAATDNEVHRSALARARERITELTIHGVDDSSPERMLNDSRVELVAGDRMAGIYRRSGARENSGEPISEAYSWSNLALSNAARALWLLFLPFMAVNLAHWAKPDGARRHRAQQAYDVLVRLLALALSVLLVALLCEVALDLVAWQCAGTRQCVEDNEWLAFVSPLEDSWWSQPGRRLTVAAVGAASVLLAVWALSHRTHEPASPPPARHAEEEYGYGARASKLALPGFWYGRRRALHLRATHFAAGLLTIVGVLVAAGLDHDRQPVGDATLRTAGWILTALVAVAWSVVLVAACQGGGSEARVDVRRGSPLVRLLPAAAVTLFVLALVYIGWSRPGWQSVGRVPGAEDLVHLTVVPWLLVVALAVTAWLLQRSASGALPALGGQAGPAFAAVACGLAVGFTASVAERFGDWLDGGGAAGEQGSMVDGPPVVLAWNAAVIPLVVLVVAALAMLAASRQWRLIRHMAYMVTVLFPEYPNELPGHGGHHDAARTRAIAVAMTRAKLTDSAPAVLGTVALAVLALSATATFGALLTDQVPSHAALAASAPLPQLAEMGQVLGPWLAGTALFLLLASGWRAYRNPAARRTIGILWDIGTFWPRAAHPLAPPSYAERAISDLTWRMTTSLRRVGGRLVVSSQGQGSVLAAAAMWQLPPTDRHRILLLTCGSPLGRLYGRWFPAYFGPRHLQSLHRDLHAWRNGWRLTDPIGGPVSLWPGQGPEVDFGPLKDPLRYGRTAHDPLPAPILGHMDYQRDPRVQEELSLLHSRIDVVPPSVHG